MLNILDFLQQFISFIEGALNAGISFLTGFLNWFPMMGGALNTIKGMVPGFMGSFVLLVLFFAGGALIIKLLPFVG